MVELFCQYERFFFLGAAKNLTGDASTVDGPSSEHAVAATEMAGSHMVDCDPGALKFLAVSWFYDWLK